MTRSESLQKALIRVDGAADQSWKDEADALIEQLARTKVPFSALDLWKRGLPVPREPRALGPRLLKAKKRGLIVETGRVVARTLYLRNPMAHPGNIAPLREWVGV